MSSRNIAVFSYFWANKFYPGYIPAERDDYIASAASATQRGNVTSVLGVDGLSLASFESVVKIAVPSSFVWQVDSIV